MPTSALAARPEPEFRATEDECLTMLELLHAKSRDLAAMLSDVEAKKESWHQRLRMVNSRSNLPSTSGRASRGGLKSTIISILRESPEGLTLGEITKQFERSANPGKSSSIAVILSRLKRQGVAAVDNGRWTLSINER